MRIVVTRTGGGFGSVSVTYSLRHVSSDASDVAATAHYTTDQTLTFPHGVVQVRTPFSSWRRFVTERSVDHSCPSPHLSVPTVTSRHAPFPVAMLDPFLARALAPA